MLRFTLKLRPAGGVGGEDAGDLLKASPAIRLLWP
jgi:hypothetical protein